MILEARIVGVLEVAVGAVVPGRGQRGISEEVVTLFLNLSMGTWTFSVCKNFIKLEMSVQVLKYRDLVDLFLIQLTIWLK